MEWHKVEDYPVGSDEYVLVSTGRTRTGCVVAKLSAKLSDGYWYDGLGRYFSVSATDRWCHIDLPKDGI